MKESVLDTQLIYALARINKMAELEELISGPNVAKIDQIGACRLFLLAITYRPRNAPFFSFSAVYNSR